MTFSTLWFFRLLENHHLNYFAIVFMSFASLDFDFNFFYHLNIWLLLWVLLPHLHPHLLRHPHLHLLHIDLTFWICFYCYLFSSLLIYCCFSSWFHYHLLLFLLSLSFHHLPNSLLTLQIFHSKEHKQPFILLSVLYTLAPDLSSNFLNVLKTRMQWLYRVHMMHYPNFTSCYQVRWSDCQDSSNIQIKALNLWHHSISS